MIMAAKKALIVDDDILVGNILVKMFSKKGIDTIVVRSGVEAYQIIAQEGAHLLLAVLDLVLPDGVTGWDLIDSIKNTPDTSNIPIIIMTGAELSESETDKLAKRVDIIVQKKTFDIDVFCKILDRLTGSKQP